MPANVLLNPLVPAVLGILVEEPAHAYQLHLEIQRRRLVADGKLSRGTLYNVVNAMERAGWITAGLAEPVPYSITDSGFGELRRWTDEQIREPVWNPDRFFHGISHIGVLGRAGAREALWARCEQLAAQIEQDAKSHADAVATGTPRLFVIEAEYALSSKRAELRWVQGISEEIAKGELKWPRRR